MGVYGLDDSGMLDGFYEWMEEVGVIKMLKEITPCSIQRMMLPFFQYVVVYFLKVLFGIESMCSLPNLLFSNEGAMKLAGFAKDRYKKWLKSHKINAVVVVEWEGKNYGQDNWVVYLTNMKVNVPIKIFDEYDQRSIIENSLFKEAKQGWFIKHAPRKNERALQVHAFFISICPYQCLQEV